MFEWIQGNWVDIAIVLIIAFSIAISFFRGFLRELVSLVTWLAAIILAVKYSVPLAASMEHLLHAQLLRYVVAFALIFSGVLVAGVIVNGALHALLGEWNHIGAMDRVLGVGFGAVRGVLVVGLMLMFIQLSSMERSDWYHNSVLAPKFDGLVEWLHEFLPKHLEQLTQWLKPSSIKSSSNSRRMTTDGENAQI